MNRRDVVLFTAVGVLLAAGIVATRRDPLPRPEVAGPPAPVVTGSLPVDRAPDPGREAGLPRLATALPREIALDPQTAVPLSADPVGRALAVFEIGSDTGSPKDRLAGQVYVLGDDGRPRRLDVVSLAPTVDINGSPGPPFGTTVLKPDGTRAAFPQRDRVVVVDLTTAAVRQIELSGLNQRVLWLGEQLLVVQTTGTFEVDPLSGRATRRPYGSGLVAGRPQGAPVLDLVRKGGTWTLRTWSDSSQTAAVPVPALPEDTDARQAGWAYGWQVALDFRSVGRQPVPEFTDRTESVLAFDSNTGTAISRLQLSGDAPPARAPGCCAVLGWLDQRFVVLDVPGEGHWLLAWEPATGKVYRISRIAFAGTRLTVSVVDGAYLRGS